MEEIASLQCKHCDYEASTDVALRVHISRKHKAIINKDYHVKK